MKIKHLQYIITFGLGLCLKMACAITLEYPSTIEDIFAYAKSDSK